MVRINNDATTCFYRIMPQILCLYLRLYQMPACFTVVLYELLRYAKYASKLRTECPRKHIVVQQTHQCSDQDKVVQCQQRGGGRYSQLH